MPYEVEAILVRKLDTERGLTPCMNKTNWPELWSGDSI